MVLSTPGTLRSTHLLNGELRVLQRMAKPIKNRQRIKLCLGTSVTNAITFIMEKEQLEPGETGLVQFRLLKPVAALPGDHFVIFPLNIKSVTGGGTVLEIPNEKYRQSRTSTILPYLKSLQRHDMSAAIEHILKNNKNRPVTAEDLALNIGFPTKDVEIKIRAKVEKGEVLDFNDGVFFGRTGYQTLKRQLEEIIKEDLLHEPLKMTVNAEEIRNRFRPSIDEALLHNILAELCGEGKVVRKNGGFYIRDLSNRLSKEQENLIGLLLDYAQDSSLAPFSAVTFCEFYEGKYEINEIRKLLNYLHAEKRLVRLNNRRFLLPQAVDRIKEMVKQTISEKGRLTLADSKEVLGYGRTVGIPVLEYLDNIGLTVRHGNERFLRKQETDRR